jgi:uncharacterized protein (TIGR02099 family)
MLGWLATALAAVLIVLAILVGIARLLLPLAGDYQQDIRSFVAAQTGLQLDFGRLSASWPLAGPEIRFYDVQAETQDGRPALAAAELRVGLNMLGLILDRRFLPGRIGLKDATLRVETLADGQLLINGIPLSELLKRRTDGPLPRLAIRLESVGVSWRDTRRVEPDVRVGLELLEVELRPGRLAFDGDLVPEAGLGRRLSVSGTLPEALVRGRATEVGKTPWSLQLDGSDLDLQRWLRILLNQAVPIRSGRGDLQLRAEFAGLVPDAASVNVEFRQLAFADSVDEPYRRFSVRGKWQRNQAGWTAALDNLTVQRGERVSPAMRGEVDFLAAQAGSPASVRISSPVLPLADLYPFIRGLSAQAAREVLFPESVRGELREVDLRAELGTASAPGFEGRIRLQEFGVVLPGEGPALTGITGLLTIARDGGQLALQSRDGLVRLPNLFREDIRFTSATGVIGWRDGPAGTEIVAEDLRVDTADAASRWRLQVGFPPGGSPVLDVTARFRADSAPLALKYLPMKRFKPNAVNWLDRAVIGGRVSQANLTWQGPLRAFPYEDGDGRFRLDIRLEDGVLDYADGWPRAEAVNARVVMDGNSISSDENQSVIGGVVIEDAALQVASMNRDAVLAISESGRTDLSQILGFLRASPISRAVGPALADVTGSGNVSARITLRVPFANPGAWRFDGTFALENASVGLKDVTFALNGLSGDVKVRNARLSADLLRGQFLAEPVTVSLRPAKADEPTLNHVAVITGSTPAGKLASAFTLPFASQLNGAVSWEAEAMLPTRESGRPLTVLVRSDLRGLVSTVAPPLSKDVGVAEPLALRLEWPEKGVMDLRGKLQRQLSFAMHFVTEAGSAWRLQRGAIHGGTTEATLPAEPGLEVSGRFDALRLEDWLPGRSEPAGSDVPLSRIDLDIRSLAALGRVFPDVEIDAERTADSWLIRVGGPLAEGSVNVPTARESALPVTMDMMRLWLPEAPKAAAQPTAEKSSDPRDLPAMRVTVADFALGEMRFGRLTASATPRGDGLLIDPLVTEAPGFSVRGDAAWLVDATNPAAQRSRLRLTLDSADAASTLAAFGYDPALTGSKLVVQADLTWPGGPGEDFRTRASGLVTLRLEDGQVLAVNPGSGRLLSLLSITALPRRLGMDFRDVLDKGLAFDQLGGEFRFDNGDAFTCNLALEGPVADLGIVGRTNFRDRTYEQIAVARPQVSDVIAIGGAVVGGPLVGGAVYLIGRIFRKPISSLGENYYRISGSWDDPRITRVQRSDVDVTPFRDCERYLAGILDAEPGASPGTSAQEEAR